MPADRYGDATDSVYAEVERLTALHRAKRPVYDDRFLSSPEITRSELAGAAAYDRAMRGGGPDTGSGTGLSHAEMDEAEQEVAAKYGRGKVNDMIHLAHASAGLGRSENERHVVLSEVVQALRRGEKAVPAHKIAGLLDAVLKQSASQGTVFGSAEEEVRLSAPAGLTQETRAMGLAAGQDGADDIAARNPDIFGLAHPSKSGKLVTTKDRAHSNQAEDYEDPADEDQPGKGGKTHAEVARYLKMRAEMFGGEALHAGSHGSHSYGPSPYRPPGASGKPQSSR
jgi:hypothetical protein